MELTIMFVEFVMIVVLIVYTGMTNGKERFGQRSKNISI